MSLWSAPAWAQGTWDANTTTSGPQDGSGTWSTSNANWWNGTTDVVWATGNAVFGTGTAGSGTAGTVTLGSNVTANNITFNAPFSGNYTIDLAGRTLSMASGGALTVNANTTISDSTGTGSLSITNLISFPISGATLTVSAKITGSTSLYTGGAGSLTLTNDANDFTGLLGKQNGGSITISSIKNSGVASAAGAGNRVQVGYNSGLIYTGGGDTTNRTLELIGDSGGRSATITNTGSGALVWTGSVTNGAGPGGTMTVNLNGSNTNDNEIQGVFANNGTNVLSINKNNAGKWILSGANTYTGATTVTGGILQIGNGGTTGSLSGSSSISVSSGATLAFSRSNTITQGTDFNSVISGAGNVTKLASGTLVITGSNTYTGTTSVNAGTLQLGESGTTGSLSASSAITGSAGATLAFNRTDTINSGTHFNNVIGGAINVAQLGSGTVVFAGANTYTGLTTINAGVLALSSAGSLASTGTVAITGSGAAFDIASAAAGRTVGMLTGTAGSAVTLGANTLTVGDATSGTFSGGIGGTGGLTKAGAGTLTLANANTYTGTTSVNAGVLQIGNGGTTGALASSSAITGSAGARLLFNRTDNYGGNISNTIGGGLGLTLSSGALTLTSANTYTGTTTITSGTLQIGSGGTGASINSTAAIVNNGSLLFNNNSDFTIAPTTGAGSLIASATTNGFIRLGGNITQSGSVSISTLTTLASSAGIRQSGNTTITASAISLQGQLGSNAGDSNFALTLDTSAANGPILIDVYNGSSGRTYIGATSITANSGTGTLTVGAQAGRFSESGAWPTATLTGGINITAAFAQGALSTGTGGFTLNATAPSTISSNLTLGGTSTNVWTVNPGVTMAVSGRLAGTGAAITKSGSGTLTLSGSNSYTGATTINAGVVALSGSGMLASTGTVAIAGSGGTFDISAANGNRTIGALTGVAGSVVTLGANSLTFGDATSGSFAGSIGGTGGVTKAGAGTLVLSGSNSFSGGVTLTGGQVQIANANALGTGTFTTNVDADTIIPLNLPTSGTIANNITINKPGSNRTYYFQQNQSNNVTLPGNITVASGNGNQFTLNGVSTGTFTLTGSNTFGGDIYTSAGITFRIGGTNAAGSTVWRPNGTTNFVLLDGASFRTTIGNVIASYGMETSGTASVTGDVNSTASGTTAINTPAGAQLTFSGVVRGGGTYNKTGAGTWVVTNQFTDANTTMNILGGTLQVPVFSALGGTTTGASYLVLNGGTLRYTGATASTTREFTLGANGGSLDASGSGSAAFTSTAPVAFTGSGNRTLTLTGTNTGNNSLAMALNDNGADVVSLSKTGAGTWVLSGSNTYTGATAVQAGVMRFSSLASGAAAQNLGSGSVVNLGLAATSAGELDYTGSGGTLDKNVFALGSGRNRIRNSGAGTLTLSGTLTKDGTILELASGTFVVTGQVTGASASSDLFVNGASVTLSNTNNDYNGPTYVYGNGTLTLGASNVVPSGSALLLGGTGSDTGAGRIITGTFTDQVASLTTSALSGTVGITVSGATAGGLTMTNLTLGGANDTLALTLSGLTLGRYNLLTYTGLRSGTFDVVTGTSSVSNYSLVYGGTSNGTIALVRSADQTLSLTPAASRVLVGGSTTLNGTLVNTTPTGGADLAVSLSSNGTLTANNFSSSTGATVTAGGTSTISATLLAGGTAGSRSWSVVNTDSGAITTTATSSGSISVVNQRTFTTSTSTLSLGLVHQGATFGSPTLVVTSTGLNATTANASLNGFTGGPAGLSLGLTSGSAAFNGGSSPQSATYTLAGTASTAGIISGTFASSVAAELGTISDVTVAVTGQVFSGTATWNVAGGGAWGTGASANWTSTGGVGAAPGTFVGYTSTDVAIFAGSQGGTSTILLDGATPSLTSLAFTNTTGPYVIDQGSGGSLSLATTTGMPTVNVAANASAEIKAGILGSQGLQKTGAGTLLLSGSNGYTGGTDVSAGTLSIDGSVGGTVTVASAAVLAGNGSIGGLVSVLGGGVLAPGSAGPGTLVAGGGLSLAANSLLNFQLSATNFTPGGGFNDLVTVSGNFTLAGVLDVAAIGGGDFSAVPTYTSWRLFDYSGGTFTNNGLSFGSMPSLGGNDRYFAIDTSTTGQVNLVLVPEPGALALAGVGFAGAAWAASRRRRRTP